jgi:hypothetical protein
VNAGWQGKARSTAWNSAAAGIPECFRELTDEDGAAAARRRSDALVGRRQRRDIHVVCRRADRTGDAKGIAD